MHCFFEIFFFHINNVQQAPDALRPARPISSVRLVVLLCRYALRILCVPTPVVWRLLAPQRFTLGRDRWCACRARTAMALLVSVLLVGIWVKIDWMVDEWISEWLNGGTCDGWLEQKTKKKAPGFI